MLRAILAGCVLFGLNGCLLAQNSYDKNDKILITLERTRCFGRCPVYTLSIAGDGTVEYDGTEFVRITGKHEAHISASKVQDLVRAFNETDYFSLKDRYDSKILADGSFVSAPEDLPMMVTSLTLGDHYKSVENWYGAPQKLRDLENKIDDVAGSSVWVANAPKPPR